MQMMIDGAILQNPLNLPAPQLTPERHGRIMMNAGRLAAVLENAGLQLYETSDLALAASVFQRSGQPLSVVADPRIHPAASNPGSTIALLLWRDGEPVGCTIQRKIYTAGLADDMRSLRYYFGPAAATAAHEDGYRAGAPEDWLAQIRHCWTVYSCSFYIDTAARGSRGENRTALIRLGHLVALARWYWQWMLGRSGAGIAARFAFNVYGFQAVVPGVWLVRDPAHYPAEPEQEPHFLIGTTREAFEAQAAHPDYGDPVADLSRPLALRAEMHAAGLD